MAHPKLATVFNRSLLAASTAALIAGPLAVAGSAQSLETVTDSVTKTTEMTCEEARKTEEAELITEFCDEADEVTEETTEKTRKRVKKEADNAAETVEKTTAAQPAPPPPSSDDDDGDEGGGDGGGTAPDSSPTGSVLPPSNSDKKPAAKTPTRSRQMRNQGEQPRGISYGGHGDRSSTSYSGGSAYSGMRSNSSLTLQPFASPLVSVPPVYELPQIAQDMFGIGDEPATATDDPMVAMADGTTATSAYSPTGAGSPADPSGWLAATATGLIMLLGAGHALNGARTPKRQRA